MKPRKYCVVIPLLLLFSLSSCFQLIEEITLQTDGSGEMQITLNLSQSRSRLASMMLLDSINGHKIPKEKDIQRFMAETVAYLEKSEGISNVRKKVDLTNYIASVTFHFKELSRLNGITRRLLREQKLSGPDNSYAFEPGAGVFKRIFRYSQTMKEGFNKLQPKDKEIFKAASYTSIFRFQQKIVSGSNQLSTVSPSGKAIMLNTPAMELINGTATISNEIQLSH